MEFMEIIKQQQLEEAFKLLKELVTIHRGSRRCTLNQLIVSVYRVLQMQGVGRADVLLYFKCPTTKQMLCPVNAYKNWHLKLLKIIS
jgi:hypothetical protein